MAAATTDHALERLVFFSDAVFAIAITLLIIEVHVPHLPPGASDNAYAHELFLLIPSFGGYVISFAVIGGFWSWHHRSFILAAHYDTAVVGWNLALLGTIAFMPFVTAFMSLSMSARLPTIFYCLVMLATALLNMRVVRIVTSPPMVAKSAAGSAVIALRRRSVGVVLGAMTALVVSAFLPIAGPPSLASIMLWQWLLKARAKVG